MNSERRAVLEGNIKDRLYYFDGQTHLQGIVTENTDFERQYEAWINGVKSRAARALGGCSVRPLTASLSTAVDARQEWLHDDIAQAVKDSALTSALNVTTLHVVARRGKTPLDELRYLTRRQSLGLSPANEITPEIQAAMAQAALLPGQKGIVVGASPIAFKNKRPDGTVRAGEVGKYTLWERSAKGGLVALVADQVTTLDDEGRVSTTYPSELGNTIVASWAMVTTHDEMPQRSHNLLPPLLVSGTLPPHSTLPNADIVRMICGPGSDPDRMPAGFLNLYITGRELAVNCNIIHTMPEHDLAGNTLPEIIKSFGQYSLVRHELPTHGVLEVAHIVDTTQYASNTTTGHAHGQTPGIGHVNGYTTGAYGAPFALVVHPASNRAIVEMERQ